MVLEAIVIDEEEDSSKTDEEVLIRRSRRERQLTKRYIDRDEDTDKDDK